MIGAEWLDVYSFIFIWSINVFSPLVLLKLDLSFFPENTVDLDQQSSEEAI